jgi:hypothetical protein
MWKSSIKKVNQYLADDAFTGFWYGQANMNSGKRVGTYFGALDAFFPGELALSGDLERAKSLEESCYRMWTKWGVEPEVLNYSNMTIVEKGYALRPEIIESAYYLYHFTKNPRYLEMGQTFFNSIVKYCRTDVAYAALSDVEKKTKACLIRCYFPFRTRKFAYFHPVR